MAESKKSRKAGRNAAACKLYQLGGRREINKAKRLFKHRVRHPGDTCATNALEALKPRHREALRELADAGVTWLKSEAA